jgi:phosphatidylserine/phosphatidylglycerophosphate/cardiolipin synthase-like enzyme
MNKKILVVTNQDFLPTLLPLIKKAKKSIDIMSYSFAIGSAAGKITSSGAPFKIAQALVERSKEIKIRLFTEGLRETVERNSVTAKYLEKNGVEIVYGSTHAKGFCFDKKTVFFGSTNLTNQSIMKNNEANLLIKDAKSAKEFMRYFDYHWEGGDHGGITLKKPFLADGDFKDELIDLIDSAKKTIGFSIYFFNHREIETALIRAHERGVKVKGFIHQHASFALPYIWANRSTVKRMKKAGIEDLHWGPPHLFSHAKYIVVDGKELMLGTGNWLVEDVVTHPQLYVHLKDVSVARSLLKHLKWQIT